MVTIGQIHLTLAITAMASGAVVLFMPKGTGPHRLIGLTYAFSMLGLNGTAFLLYNLFGRVGLFQPESHARTGRQSSMCS